MKTTCLIIDDDAGARAILKNLIKQDPRLSLIAEVDGSTNGAISVTKNKPDLIFLDLQMPGLDGYEMLEVLDYMPKIIIYSTERHYKSELFKDKISAYLYKPVENFSMFREAVDKALKKN